MNREDNVETAFNMLLEEVENEINSVAGAGAEAFKARESSKVTLYQDQMNGIIAFRDKLTMLRKEWYASHGDAEETVVIPEAGIAVERRNLGRLDKGKRTVDSEFCLPILHVLLSLGGRAKLTAVLPKVGDMMKSTLRDVDYEPLKTEPNSHRWINTAQWARSDLAQQGYISKDSPRGIWELTDKGREAARKNSL